jgi:hypothetical protein
MHRAPAPEAARKTLVVANIGARIGAAVSRLRYGLPVRCVMMRSRDRREAGLRRSEQQHRQDHQPCDYLPHGAQPGARHSFLPGHPANGIDQFLDLVPLLDRITCGESPRDTVRNVIPKNLLFNLMKRRSHRIDLDQNVHAIPVLFDHAKQASNLALYPLQTGRNTFARHLIHSLIHNPCGVYNASK